MDERPEHADADPREFQVPTWMRTVRLTKEQLAAAERTRAWHLRRLQINLARTERATEPLARPG